jgi:K(+)-stimulated pyrophosphate-energized sodium pump
MNNMLIYIVPVLGIVALIVMAIKSAWVSKQGRWRRENARYC